VLLIQVKADAKHADESVKRLGFIAHCFSCGHRLAFPYEDLLEMRMGTTCELCGKRMKIAGPLYLHPIADQQFCEQVHEELGNRRLGKQREAMKIVSTCSHELRDIPYFFELHALCKALKIPPPPLAAVIETLRSKGFAASRTQFSDTGVKTNARIDELKALVKEL
jgi:tRNA (guanine26-N2/guanine27-N2)-dimethyltransferase